MSKSRLLNSLQCLPENRLKDDIDRINTYLAKINDLLHCNTEELTICSKIVKSRTFERNHIIYKKSENVYCWYYIMTGSVLIGSEMFVANKSFGIKEENITERTCDCLVLEETTVLIFYYENCPHTKYPCPCIKKRVADGNSNLDSTSTFIRKLRKSQHGSDTSSGYSGSDRISTGGGDTESSVSWQIGNDFNNNNVLRHSTGSNSQRTGIIESDDESDEDHDFSDCLSTEMSIHDTIKDILMKVPKDRTSQETDTIMSIIHNISIFSLWTQSLRHIACQLAQVKVIEHAGTVLVERGQKLQNWGYCLQGTLEVRKSLTTSPNNSNRGSGDGSDLADVLDTLRYSDHFGADLRIDKDQVSSYFLVTTSDDCCLMLIDVDEFKQAKSQEPETISSVQENQKTVVVMENRPSTSTRPDEKSVHGKVLVKATSQKLIDYLFENHSEAEQYFIEDFFLTYNIHLESTVPIRNTIIDQITRWPNRRVTCTNVVVTWISNQFPEIELQQPDTLKFIEMVVLILLRESEDELAGRICHACSEYSSKRSVTIFTRNIKKSSKNQQPIIGSGSRVPQSRANQDTVTRDNYPIEYSRLNQFKSNTKLIGLYYCYNNVTNQNDSSQQLRVGDRIIQINSTSEEYLTSKNANDIVESSQMCTFTVKYDPEGYYLPFLKKYQRKNSINSASSSTSSSSILKDKKVERSASIHSGLIKLSDDNDSICTTDELDYNDTQYGYSTLPLKPTLITMAVNNQPQTSSSRKSGAITSSSSSSTSASNQSALKKMMKRCKANNASENSKKFNSMSLLTNSINSNSNRNRCRSAHTSPNRSSSNNSNSLSNTLTITKSQNGLSPSARSTSGESMTSSNQNQQIIKLRKLRNRCDSQPDLRKMNGGSSANLMTVQPFHASFYDNNESVIKITYKEISSTSNSLLNQQSDDTFSSLLRSNSKTLYMLVRKETEAIEVIMKSIKELNLSCNSSSDFVLVEVTLEPGTMLKQKTIKQNQANLPALIRLNSRLYLKRRDYSGQLLDQNEIEEIESEMNQQSLLNLSVAELAVQIFVESYNSFAAVSATEIIDFVTNKSRREPSNIESNPKTENPTKFSEYMRLGEKYMFFVVTAICSEYSSTNRRCKILKRIIKLARLCKELGNIEIFFSLMNGLDRIEVKRLHQTWEKLPNKEMTMYRQMQEFLDVSGNMRLLRNLHTSSPKPVISMAALVTKDLTTVHEVHPTRVSADNSNIDSSDSSVTLINFEKLRIMSRLIRIFKNSIFNCTDKAEVYHNPHCYLLPFHDEVTQTEILRDQISRIENKGKNQSTISNRRMSVNINPKKLYEKELCRLRTKHFLQRYDKIEKDDAVLLSLSHKCESKSEFGSTSITPSISRNTFANTIMTTSNNFDKESNISLRHSTTGSISSKDSIRYSSGSEHQFMMNIMNNQHHLDSSYNTGSLRMHSISSPPPISSQSSSSSSSNATTTSIATGGGQLQYLEPSIRRHVPPPPPYSSLNTHNNSGQPPIPPRRRSSTTPDNVATTKSNKIINRNAFSPALSKDEEATHL